MNLLAISINHRTAPVEMREALHLSEDEIKNFIRKVKGTHFREGLVISTCNRTEIYGIPVNSSMTHDDVQNLLLQHKAVEGIKQENFQNYHSASALSHLFDVISGIDSLLIGDNQIFKQVKDHFQISEDQQFADFLMKRVFDSATRTGRRAITETEISEGAVTVSYAAVQLIEKIFSTLNKKSALVIGAGETGEIAAKHLKERGIGTLAITNRTIEKAEKLAEGLKAKIIPFTNFKDYLHEYDIVLSATSSPDLILEAGEIKKAMKRRSYASMILMDIAIPRDIAPESRDIDYVFYHDIDSLNIIVEQNLSKRKEEIPRVKDIINEELNAFLSWYNSLEVAPTIRNIREHFENIRAIEVEKNINRFSDEDREKLEIVTKRIINKILHHPTVELKKLADGNNDEIAAKISIIREIFGINNGDIEKN